MDLGKKLYGKKGGGNILLLFDFDGLFDRVGSYLDWVGFWWVDWVLGLVNLMDQVLLLRTWFNELVTIQGFNV